MKKIVCCALCLALLFAGTVSAQSLLQRAAGLFTGSTTAEKTPGTHQHKGTISITLDDRNVEIHTFCVDKKGRLLVAVGGTQFEYKSTPDGSYSMEQVKMRSAIHVFTPDGKEEAIWKINVTPQALAVGPDNSVYAAGMGKIVRLDESGKVLKTIDSPHMAGLPELPPIPAEEPDTETAEQKEAKQERILKLRNEMRDIMKKIMEKHQEYQKIASAGDRDAQVKLQEEMTTLISEEYTPLQEEQQKLTQSPRQIAMQERNAAMQARSVKSIGVTDKYIFICTPPAKGYASEVWRVDSDFTNPKVIVKGLSGCCGQMNISAVGDKLVIPENARKKVHVYDAEGTQLHSWGADEDKNAVSGWGSCCNPMNIAFDGVGNVLTSEASVGAIKRFKLDGTFIETVAESRIVPGCKHTPIGMSLDGTKAYMLDITKRNIIVMEKE